MKDQEAEVFFQLCGLIKFRNDTYKLFDEISSSLRFTRLEIDFGIEPENLFFLNISTGRELQDWNSPI